MIKQVLLLLMLASLLMPATIAAQRAPDVRVAVWLHDAGQGLQGIFEETKLADGTLQLLPGHAQGLFVAAPIEVGFPFNAMLVTWRGEVDARESLSIEARSSVDGQAWQEWHPLLPLVQGEETVSQLLALAPNQRWLQYRVHLTAQFDSPRLSTLRITALDTSAGPTLDDLAPQPLVSTNLNAISAPSVSPYSAWSGATAAASPTPHRPRRIEIVPLGTAAPDADQPAALRAMRWAAQNRWGYADVPYHLIVDGEGRVYGGAVPVDARLPDAEAGAIRIGVWASVDGELSETARAQLADLLEWLLGNHALRLQDIDVSSAAPARLGESVTQVQATIDGRVVRSRRIFAAGGEASQQQLVFFNPTNDAARATITAYTPAGEQQHSIDVPAGRRNDVALNTLLGEGSVAGIDVQANRLLYAERIISDSASMLSSGGAAEPARAWYFAAGSTLSNTDTLLTVLNPQAEEVAAQLTFYADGSDPITHTATLAPRSQTSLPLRDLLPESQFGIQLVAARPVVAERIVRIPSDAAHLATGSDTLQRRWSFAEGVTTTGYTTTLHLLNPWPQRVALTLQIMSEDGTSLTRRYAAPPQAQTTLVLNEIVPDLTFAFDISAERPIAAERVVQVDDGVSAAATAGSPELATRWTFAAGTTLDADQFLLIGNPQQTTTELEVQYILANGATIRQRRSVPPTARLTLLTNTDVPDQPAVATIIVASQPVVAERTLLVTTPQGQRIETSLGERGK
jgi:hypothetical protein